MFIWSSRQIPAPQMAVVERMPWGSPLRSGCTPILKSCTVFQTFPCMLLRHRNLHFVMFGISQKCNKNPTLLPYAPLLSCPRNPNPAQTRLQVKRSSSAPNFANNVLCDLKQTHFLPMLQLSLVIRKLRSFSLHFTRYLNLRWDLGWSHHRKDATREKKKS